MQNIPTIQQIVNGIIADIEAQMGNTISTSGKSFLRALANVEGAEIKLLYLVLGNIQKNLAPDLADSEQVGGMLERYGRIKLGRNPFGATSATYQVQVLGEIGAVINGQTTFKSDDDSLNPGNLYILDNAFTLVTGNDIILLRALTAGTAAKLNTLDTLTSTSPIAFVNSRVTVSGTSIQPLDAESIEAYRLEVLNTYRLEPQGGAATDYRLWSQDAAGVANVYPYAASGYTNRMNLYVEAELSASTDGKGTPSAGTLAAVEAVVNFSPDDTLQLFERGRRPITVVVNYLPVTIIQVDIQVPSFVGITADKQTLILNALTLYISAIRPFVAAADILSNKNDTLSVNGITSVILAAIPGSSFAAPILNINGSPVTSYQFTDGNIPDLNSITYP